MKVAIHDHQCKSLSFANALLQAGHQIVTPGNQADALLVDFCGTPYYDRVIGSHSNIFMYPHGANPILSWDGIYPMDERIRANFVVAEGHAEIYRRLDYPPSFVTGWTFCEQKEFEPRGITNVLFGPQHPLGNGFLHEEARLANIAAYRRLLKAPIDLTVRYLGSLEDNGLWIEEGIEYVGGNPDGSTREIDNADLVVANGTFAMLAIARGKPTVMFGQNIRPCDGPSERQLKCVKHWHLYRDYMRYPYDVEAPNSITEIMQRANECEAVRWRQLFIGESFDGSRFADRFEALTN